MIDIPTEPQDLANLLEKYSNDWESVLGFLESLANSRGIVIDVDAVSKIMKERYSED